MCFLVNFVKERIQSELVEKLYKVTKYFVVALKQCLECKFSLVHMVSGKSDKMLFVFSLSSCPLEVTLLTLRILKAIISYFFRCRVKFLTGFSKKPSKCTSREKKRQKC